MFTLGISAYYHDSAACILRDGQIIAAAQEERFTRKKHDPAFPLQAIRFCLDYAQVTLEDIETVIFYDKPFLKFERILETFYAIAPRGLSAFVKHMPEWIKEKIFFKKLLKEGLTEVDRGEFKKVKLHFSEHHLSHAAWAYYTSPFKESAILTIDGVGEWTTTSIFKGVGNEIEVLKEQHFPHSVGLLYSSFTQFLGFKVNDGEYKMMGLAPYGNREGNHYENFRKGIEQSLVTISEDGSIRLNLSYFSFLLGKRMIIAAKWHDLFSLAMRAAKDPIEQVHCDFALAAQDVTEEVILKLAREAKRVTGSNHLCLSGGVAYNCVANGRLLREGIFKEVFVPPAVGDSGGSGGAALASYYLGTEEKRDITLFEKNRISFLGPVYSSQQIEAFLLGKGVSFEQIEDGNIRCKRAAELLVAGAVIGWMQGRMEFGARALGARSIVASPQTPDIQRIVNQKIKFRESFRPFAPVMLEEDLEQYFELSEASPYMALVSAIKKEYQKPLPAGYPDLNLTEKSRLEKSSFPGITHVDYSSRIQTVEEKTNPNFWPLLMAYKDITGNSLLINTSFNVKDEPIVCSPADAYNCFMKTKMDFLFLGDFLISKQESDVSAQRSWQVFNPAKEVLAYAYHTGVVAPGLFNCLWWRLCHVSFYLFLILSFVKAPEIKQSAEAIVLGLVSGLLAIFLLAQWRWDKTIPELIYIAAGIGLLSVLSKQLTMWVAICWMGLGQLMGKVVGSVLLTLVYLMILTPIAWFQSVISKSDKFKSGKQVSKQSSWIHRVHEFSNKDLKELW